VRQFSFYLFICLVSLFAGCQPLDLKPETDEKEEPKQEVKKTATPSKKVKSYSYSYPISEKAQQDPEKIFNLKKGTIIFGKPVHPYPGENILSQ